MDESTGSTLATTRDIVQAIVTAEEPLLDDSDRLAIVRVAVDAMARRLRSLGRASTDVDAARTEALEAAREAYVALWIRNAYEDEGGSVDEDAERRAALAAFAERGS